MTDPKQSATVAMATTPPATLDEIGPAAQAGELILAYRKGADEVPHPLGLAAALNAVADQVMPELGRPRTAAERTLYHEGRLDAAIRHRAHLLAIAAELVGKGND